MQPAVEKFTEAIMYESRKEIKISNDGKVSKAIKDLAKQVLKKKKLILTAPGRYLYNQCNGEIFEINIESKTCSCDRFLDKAACKHLTAACMLEDIALNGLKSKRNLLQTRSRRAKHLIFDSDNEEPDEINNVSALHDNVQGVSDSQDLVHENVHEPTQIDDVQASQHHAGNVQTDDIIKPKRGRPTRAEQALRREKALEDNSKKQKKGKEHPKSDRITRSRK